MTQWTGLRIDQLDTLLFRDSRPFTALDKARSLPMPMPQTIAGALRTKIMISLGCDFGRAGDDDKRIIDDVMKNTAFRGPWFVRNSELLFPCPATLMETVEPESKDSKVVMIRPYKDIIPWWSSADSLKPLWRKSIKSAKRMSSLFITMRGMQSFLKGEAPDKCDFVDADALYGFDRRTGIEIDSDTLTAAESKIFSTAMLCLEKDVSLYVEISANSDWIDKALGRRDGVELKFGGEGRYARLERLDKPMLAFGSAPDSDGNGAMRVLLTPGLFNGWKPSNLNGNLVSAATAGYEPVSGWDLASEGPKPARFAVAAGSVYFFDDRPRIGAIGGLCAGEDAALGYGIYVEGKFDYV